MFSFEIDTRGVIKALEKVKRGLEAQVNKEIAGAAMRATTKAKMRLQPESWDSKKTVREITAVRQSINYNVDTSEHSAQIFAGNVSGDNIAAYLEFGTGPYAARYVPKLKPEFQALARTFYVNGKGRLSEHPFLIPAFESEGVRLVERLKNLKVSW
jgi:hypothetical protein